ncbi:MAG: hypothetical protein PHS37_04355 [Candidatus Omnitrophica bacterium]|nr:hypothetical protein [Candidatus Omnitrophota bacterium]
MPDDIQVSIPLDLYHAVKKIVAQTEALENPNDVIAYALRQFAPHYKDTIYSDAEHQEIKKRLKDLGYM